MLRNFGKSTSEPLKNISCFRIVKWFPNCWRNKFFSAVILRCPISPGKHRYEPLKHKMPLFSQNNFFGIFIFSVTKAIHTYVLAKFEKNYFFYFQQLFSIFYRRPLLRSSSKSRRVNLLHYCRASISKYNYFYLLFHCPQEKNWLYTVYIPLSR